MKFLIALLLIIATGYAAYLYASDSPWWIFAIGAFLVGWAVPLHPFKSWLSGFLGIFLLWASLLWFSDAANYSVMSSKMAALLPLNGSSLALLLVSALVGGLVGGMACLSGAFLRKTPVK
jgi:hypothetical protein